MPSNFMVTYVGPKKHIYVPFTADSRFPVESNCEIVDTVRFERNQMVELPPERAHALVKQSPDVFKLSAPIRPAPKAVTIRKDKPPTVPQIVELTEAVYLKENELSPGQILDLPVEGASDAEGIAHPV